MYRQAVDPGIELAFPLLSDAEPLFALVDDERDRLREWLSWPEHVESVDDTRSFVRSAREDAASGRAYHHIVRVEGHPAGVLSLELNRSKTGGEIGYWLGQRYESRGLITRGIVVLLDTAFGRLGLHRVEIRVAPDNQRSRAIPQRLGFQCDGRLREASPVAADGIRHDHEVWSMLAAEWPDDNA